MVKRGEKEKNMDRCKEKQTSRILPTAMNILGISFKPSICETCKYLCIYCVVFMP